MDEIKKEIKMTPPPTPIPPSSPKFNEFNDKPDDSYYTMENVEHSLPKIPLAKVFPKFNPLYDKNGVIGGTKNSGVINNNNNNNNKLTLMYPPPLMNESKNLQKKDATPTTTTPTTRTMMPTPGTPNFPLSPHPKFPLTPPPSSILQRHFQQQQQLKQQQQQQQQQKEKEQQNLQKLKKEGTKTIPIPWFVRPIVNMSPDRAKDRAARVYKLGFRTAEGRTEDVYIIFLFYQIIIGAIGGIAVAIETGYLSPLPPLNPVGSAATADVMGKQALQSVSMIWRSAKRAAAAGLLFNFMDKNIEESRNKSDWKNSAYAGAICGAMLGIRGGTRGSFMGGTMFATFAGLSGFLDDLKRKNRAK